MSLRPRWFDRSLVALLAVTCTHLLLSCVTVFREAQETGKVAPHFYTVVLYILHWGSLTALSLHVRSRLYPGARRSLVAFNFTLAIILIDYASAMFTSKAVGAARLSLALIASLLANPVAAHVWRRRQQPVIVTQRHEDGEPFETFFLESYGTEMSIADVESDMDTQSSMQSIELLKKD